MRSPASTTTAAVSTRPPLCFMGVINVTPDSFSDGGAHFEPERAIEHGLALVAAGADILDIGGESTRPGALGISVDDELARVLPVVRGLARQTRCAISIDTTKATVARAALDLGATIVNDIAAARFDEQMLPLIAERGATWIAMHMQGTALGMQRAPAYVDVVLEVREFLAERAAAALALGVRATRIWIDPGIGFGKTLEHNLALVAQLGSIVELGWPVCLGVSRKSFIAAIEQRVGRSPSPVGERFGGTAAALLVGVQQGASILRVHDVALARQALLVARALGECTQGTQLTALAPGTCSRHDQ